MKRRFVESDTPFEPDYELGINFPHDSPRRYSKTPKMLKNRAGSASFGADLLTLKEFSDIMRQKGSPGFWEEKAGRTVQHVPVWRTRNGREMRIEDMETAHLINAVAMIARNQLRRKHGIRDELDDLNLADEDLAKWFDDMRAELEFRLERKNRRPK